jgi:hypothetical protein
MEVLFFKLWTVEQRVAWPINVPRGQRHRADPVTAGGRTGGGRTGRQNSKARRAPAAWSGGQTRGTGPCLHERRDRRRMWCASCLASACAGCACNLCTSAASAVSRRSARLAYCGLFAASLVLSLLLRQFATPLLKHIPCTWGRLDPSHPSALVPLRFEALLLLPPPQFLGSVDLFGFPIRNFGGATDCDVACKIDLVLCVIGS